MSKLNFNFPIAHPGLEYLDQLDIWKGGHFGVEKITALMRFLGNPQDRIRSFHVTGTNGKGTTSTVLASILGATGARVGLNTSPHLFDPNERIVVDGKPVGYETIGEAAVVVRDASQRTGIELSFHEGITATAFIVFRDLKVDWNVIEVGLGGRFDASNVIAKPEASIITTIDLDHQHILGETRPQIAYEKAGIIKTGCPVVVGPIDDQSIQVIKNVAQERRAPLYQLEGQFFSTSFHDKGLISDHDSFEFSINNEKPFSVTKRIRGRHQMDNFSLALAAARLAGVSERACQEGVINAFWPGRLEVFNWKNRTIIVDCAHNPHGVSALVDNLMRWGVSDIDVAFGVLDGKNWREMVNQLKPFGKSWDLLLPNSERALDLNVLSDYLSSIGVNSTIFGREFDKFILKHDSRGAPLLITGSIYLIGEVRKLFIDHDRPLWIKN